MPSSLAEITAAKKANRGQLPKRVLADLDHALGIVYRIRMGTLFEALPAGVPEDLMQIERALVRARDRLKESS